MTESLSTSHSDLMNLRAKGKKLHRRTQSHTTFSLGEVVNKKNTSEEFIHEMLQTHNILNGDITQKVLDAVNKDENEKEVIVDDIDEIPNTGIIIPQGFSNNLNNPLNNLQKRSLLMKTNFQATGSQFKKMDMLNQVKNIDDITGLNTIHEKRNSMESIETENMNKRSLNVTNSGSSSQNISKNVSRAHSKHPSLDFRVGHSNSSSVDFRPLHSKKPSADMWSMHSKQSSVDIKPTHIKQSSADFRTLPKDIINFGIRVEKEIDVVKYNLQSPKAIKVGETIQQTPNSEYIDKRNRFITELQKCSIDRLKKGNTVPDNIPTKSSFKTEETKQKSKLTHTNTLDNKDKSKVAAGATAGAHQTNSKHRRTYSGNVGKAGELISPREDLASSAIFFNGKNPKEMVINDYSNLANMEPLMEATLELRKLKTVQVDDSMKKLTTKTDLLEGQIKNIFCIIESFANEKASLEDKIQTQDQKIKELMDLTRRYQEEIKVLKGKGEPKTMQSLERRSGSNKGDQAGLNILTTTDGSAFESSLTESSGYISNKDNRIKPKPVPFSLTPHHQTKSQVNKVEDRKSLGLQANKSEVVPRPQTSKTEDRKSLGLFGNKSEIVPKKTQVGTKKPTIKKL